MSSDPAASGKDAVRALQRLGFRLDRVEGSHHMLIKDAHPHTVVVPVHGSKPLPNGTLASVIRLAVSARSNSSRQSDDRVSFFPTDGLRCEKDSRFGRGYEYVPSASQDVRPAA